MKLSFITAAVLLTMAAAPAAHAQSLSITGGVTSVRLIGAPALTNAGLSVAPLGSGLLSPGSTGIPVAYFPITGGSIDTTSFAGSILHEGSGLLLSSSGASATVSLTNFVINTTTNLLSGNVSTGGSSLGFVPLFNIGASGVPAAPFSLALTAAAANALTTVFGIPNLTGAVLGNANTIPITAAVPEPATVVSMLMGLALIGSFIRRSNCRG